MGIGEDQDYGGYRKVTIREGIGYGLSLFGYIIGVGFLVGFGVLIGLNFGGLVGGLIVLLSLIGFAAGLVSIQFKIIADGVAAGLVIYNES